MEPATIPETGNRAPDGKFLPGRPSANPHGRPRSGLALSEAIRRRVDPNELVDIAFSIARGIVPRPLLEGREAGGVVTFVPEVVEMSHRMAALNWLARYGYIPPPQQLEVSGGERRAIDFSRCSAEQIAALDGILDSALGPTSPERYSFEQLEAADKERP